jgi:hypothetical protein
MSDTTIGQLLMYSMRASPQSVLLLLLLLLHGRVQESS